MRSGTGARNSCDPWRARSIIGKKRESEMRKWCSHEALRATDEPRSSSHK
jgi:hypothetical protein